MLRQSLAACVFNLPRETGDGSHSHPRHGWWLRDWPDMRLLGDNGIIYCCHGGTFLQLILNIPEILRRLEETITLLGGRSYITVWPPQLLVLVPGPVTGNSPDFFNLVVRNIGSPLPLYRTHLKLKHWPSNLKACWTAVCIHKTGVQWVQRYISW